MSENDQDPSSPPALPPSELSLLRAEVAALREKVKPKTTETGRAICNGCGAEVKEGERCATHTTETVNVCLSDGTFRAY